MRHRSWPYTQTLLRNKEGFMNYGMSTVEGKLLWLVCDIPGIKSLYHVDTYHSFIVYLWFFVSEKNRLIIYPPWNKDCVFGVCIISLFPWPLKFTSLLIEIPHQTCPPPSERLISSISTGPVKVIQEGECRSYKRYSHIHYVAELQWLGSCFTPWSTLQSWSEIFIKSMAYHYLRSSKESHWPIDQFDKCSAGWAAFDDVHIQHVLINDTQEMHIQIYTYKKKTTRYSNIHWFATPLSPPHGTCLKQKTP